MDVLFEPSELPGRRMAEPPQRFGPNSLASTMLRHLLAGCQATAGTLFVVDDRWCRQVSVIDSNAAWHVGHEAISMDSAHPVAVALRTGQADFSAGSSHRVDRPSQSTAILPFDSQATLAGCVVLTFAPGRSFAAKERRQLRAYAGMLAAALGHGEMAAKHEQSILQAVPESVVAVSSRGAIRYANSAAQELFGVSADTIIGQKISQFLPGHSTEEALQEEYTSHCGSAEAYRLTGRRADGQTVELEAKIEASTLGGESISVYALHDCSERLRDDEALIYEWLSIEAIFNAVDALIVTVDSRGHLVRWNAACEVFTGKSFDHVSNKPLWEVLGLERHEASSLRERLNDLSLSNYPKRFQSTWVDRHQSSRTIAWANTVVRNEFGELRYLICTGQDVTERLAYEQELQAAAQQKDDFLAMLGHELRNPLAAILTAAQLQKLIQAKEPRLVRTRQVIERQVAHMSRLLDDLLDLSRLVRGKFRLRHDVVDIVEVVRLTAEDYEEAVAGKGIKLLCKFPSAPVKLLGDRVRLVQIVDNLLNNAVKFTSEGEIRVQVAAHGDSVVLTVADTGVGIEPESLRHVFEPFRQAECSLDHTHGGLGLGLSVVQGLAKMHGGVVQVHSAGHQQGSEFRVILPVGGQATDEKPPSMSEPQPGKRRRVLVVEDNVDAGEALQEVLRQLGHETCLVHDVSGALEVLAEFHPDLVLCDVGLPGEKSGYDFARMVRADLTHQTLVLVAVTGFGRREDKEHARAAGFDVHLTKPVVLSHLQRVLDATYR